MKLILITGVHSYVGNAAERYLNEYNAKEGRELYRVDKLSLRDETWENVDFTPYDCILHVAGIAHADVGHVSEETKQLYYRVNCDLAVKVAKKAKAAGVKQFIYMSSVIVYGDSAAAGHRDGAWHGATCITEQTRPAPANFYGDSKLQAELKLRELESEQFAVAAVRAPMIYGKDSKGNFPLLAKLAAKVPFFPNIKNERSMLYIENLAEFLRLLIDSGKGGILFPQNEEYVTTAGMVKSIGAAMGRKIYLWSWLNPFVKLAARMPGKIGGMVHKAFGSLTIDKELSNRDIQDYRIFTLEESIQKIYEN